MLSDPVQRVATRYPGAHRRRQPGLAESLYVTGSAALGEFRPDAFPARWHPIVAAALRCRALPLAPPGSGADAEARREQATAFMAAAIAAAHAMSS